MERRPTWLVLLWVCVCVTACASMMFGSEPWFESHNFGRVALERRASFDLSCPIEQLQFAPLGAGRMSHTTVGVSGCDGRIVYVFLNGNWVANTENQ